MRPLLSVLCKLIWQSCGDEGAYMEIQEATNFAAYVAS
jgi:hypothetical protein